MSVASTGTGAKETSLCDAGSGFVRAHCMSDRAERQAIHNADQQPRVVCRSAWSIKSRSPHPAGLAQGLSRLQLGGERSVVGGALQFA